MVGASGAISGVLGGYILLHPGATVRVLIFLGFFVTITHVPALIVLGFWFAVQLFSAASAAGRARRRLLGAYRRLRRRPRAGLPLQAPQRASARKAAQRPFEMERRRGPWGDKDLPGTRRTSGKSLTGCDSRQRASSHGGVDNRLH